MSRQWLRAALIRFVLFSVLLLIFTDQQSGSLARAAWQQPVGGPASPDAQVSLEVVTKQIDPSTAAGEIATKDSSLRIIVPKGAAGELLRLELKPLPPTATTLYHIVKRFEINAYATNRGDAPVTQFQKDVELRWTYTDEELAGLDMRGLRMLYFDEAASEWVPLPGSVDFETKTVIANTNHFSMIGGGSVPEISGPGGVLGFQTDLHSGSATFSYPIELPPAPGGFQPSLNLVYNSASVDEMQNDRDTGSWVGTGWSMHFGRISHNRLEGKYYLELNGAGYELVQDTGGIWHTKPESYLKVFFASEFFAGSWAGSWEVTDKDGTKYEFANTDDSRQVYWFGAYLQDYYRFDLNRVVDVHGNEMIVKY